MSPTGSGARSPDRLPAAQAAQRTAVISQIQTECNQQTQPETARSSRFIRAAFIRFNRYRRFSDLRLVMAPEGDIGILRWRSWTTLHTPVRSRSDVASAFTRTDQPYSPPDYLKWSAGGAVENELVFVVGNPGSTGRLNTIAQMEIPP